MKSLIFQKIIFLGRLTIEMRGLPLQWGRGGLEPDDKPKTQGMTYPIVASILMDLDGFWWLRLQVIKLDQIRNILMDFDSFLLTPNLIDFERSL